MFEDFAPRLAQVLTGYSIPIQPGDYVTIEGPTVALPLIEALYEAVLQRGGNPVTRIFLPDLEETLLSEGSDEQITFLDPTLMTFIEQTDVMFYIFAETNTRMLSTVDPARVTRYLASRQPWMETYMRRHSEGTLRWNATAWPTNADAQEAEMGLLAYTGFVYNACGLGEPDPVAHWRAFHERQERLIDWLQGKERVEVRGPGIDLTLSVAGRTWMNASGHVNFPDGEIFTAPVEDSVNGQVVFSYPTVYLGRRVEGVRLAFKDGLVVEASAGKGEDHLLSQLDIDAGTRRLGEFAIGTNNGIRHFTGKTLFDEKIGGTIHMALGNSYGDTGGLNQSAIHWDMVHGMQDGGEIWIDGELFYRAGQFMVG